MTRTVPLSQFMPYGAPELLAAAPRYLSRAVTASCSLAVAAFFIALAIAPHWVREPRRIVAVRPKIELTEPRPTIERLPPPPLVAPVRPRTKPDEGAVRPVADPAEPVPQDPFRGSSEKAVATGQLSDTPISEPPRGTDDLLPERNAPVYAEEWPAAVTEIRPEYPALAREAGVEGLVIVHVLVGKDGRVVKTEVEEKFSIPLLNEAALAAARRWVFTPALMNQRPVAVWVALRFNFKLHER